MKIYRFKTDIHCNGCITKLEKELQNHKEVSTWKIDINTKELKISGDILDIEQFENQIFERTQIYIEAIKN